MAAEMRYLFKFGSNILCNMATFQTVKKAVTLAPTVRTLPSGIPVAPLLNLNARAPSSGHDHDSHHGGPRSDIAPRWAGGVSRDHPFGLISKSYTMGEYLEQLLYEDLTHYITDTRSPSSCNLFRTTPTTHLCGGQGCLRRSRLHTL